MPNGFDVLPDELRGHASRLDALGERLGTALSAANQVNLGNQAYGVICQFFVPIVHSVSDPGVEALRQASTAMGTSAKGVRDTAVAYDRTEEANRQPFAGGR
jgi:excreted virulence factor EspC (type VII ESX diderm)